MSTTPSTLTPIPTHLGLTAVQWSFLALSEAQGLLAAQLKHMDSRDTRRADYIRILDRISTAQMANEAHLKSDQVRAGEIKAG